MAKIVAPTISEVTPASTDVTPILKEQYTPKIRDLINGEHHHDPHHKHNHTNVENSEGHGNDHGFHGQVRAMQMQHRVGVIDRAKGHLSRLIKVVKSKREE